MTENGKPELFLHAGESGMMCKIGCILCGAWFRPDICRAELQYRADEKTTTLGVICDQCLEAGPRGAAKMARQYAQDLKEFAEQQEAVASEIENWSDDYWFEVDELRAASLRTGKEWGLWQDVGYEPSDDDIPF